MAFTGNLLKLGNYVFPMEYIEAESYDATYITQDIDSQTSATGILNRNVVPHRPIKISFNLIDSMTNKELAPIMKNMRDNYLTGDVEKKLRARAYMPEIDDYVSQDVYFKPDTNFPIDYIDGNTIYYRTINFVFTGY